jgi:hypothetical protein
MTLPDGTRAQGFDLTLLHRDVEYDGFATVNSQRIVTGIFLDAYTPITMAIGNITSAPWFEPIQDPNAAPTESHESTWTNDDTFTAIPMTDVDETALTPGYLTRPINYLGLCALSLPAGFSNGLPIGLQIVGKPFQESTVLSLGQAFESSTDFHQHHPDLSFLGLD